MEQARTWHLCNTRTEAQFSELSLDAVADKLKGFDKSVLAEWHVWTEGFSGWTIKSNAYGVCPPEEILKDTLTIRIHLDETDELNGALKVVPGSHTKKLTNSEIQVITQNSIPFTFAVDECGIQIMKPLLLHAS